MAHSSGSTSASAGDLTDALPGDSDLNAVITIQWTARTPPTESEAILGVVSTLSTALGRSLGGGAQGESENLILNSFLKSTCSSLF